MSSGAYPSLFCQFNPNSTQQKHGFHGTKANQTAHERKAELLAVHIQKISSSPDVFAKAQPIVKVKQLKSEESARLNKIKRA
ncbi:hypothetical protein [Pectobacterium sp. B1J-3]|uniref:hypothetical protein n=1 Tax=Pectobacterium sp. B1J-3 TaxID=3385371 RepID=UPI0039069F88